MEKAENTDQKRPDKKIRNIFQQFRDSLDELMLPAMHRRVLLYGYESYKGWFIKWYAEYYHNIKIDYLVSSDMSRSRGYVQEIFRPSLLDFDYRDAGNAVIWLAEPVTEELRKWLENRNEGTGYYDFYEAVYGSDINWDTQESTDAFNRRKAGKRDIQFFEWLEWKYHCNFLTAVEKSDLEVAFEHGSPYRCTTQKEIFPILDKCHCMPDMEDGIFDYGCGKGSALVSFLDYGFKRVGGVEYEPGIYHVLTDNMRKLGLGEEDGVELICGDAGNLDTELDSYNWFYFFLPFDTYIFEKCMNSICRSYQRKKRKIHIISISPFSWKSIENTGIFRLVNQFTVDMRQRVVDVYESI